MFIELYVTFMLIVDTTKYPMLDFDWLVRNSEASPAK